MIASTTTTTLAAGTSFTKACRAVAGAANRTMSWANRWNKRHLPGSLA